MRLNHAVSASLAASSWVLLDCAAPLALVVAASLFPVRGALIDVGLALLVFASGEAVRRFAGRWRVLDLVLTLAYDFERYYRERPPNRGFTAGGF